MGDDGGGGGDARPARPEYATRRGGTTRGFTFSPSLTPHATRSNPTTTTVATDGALAVIQQHGSLARFTSFVRYLEGLYTTTATTTLVDCGGNEYGTI